MRPEQHDVAIRGAMVYDGSGAAPVRADLGIRDGRVSGLGELREPAGSVLQADGLAIAPGFIDVHTHDDFAAVLQPEMDFKVLQGVTTDVVGNCGMGAAPFDQAALFARAIHPKRTLPRWEGYRGYLAALDEEPPSLNVAALVGHGTVRAAVLGADQRRPPSARELDQMRDLLREGLEAGCVGFSSGLIYEPGRHAQTEELIELAREMSQIGGLYATHMRDESEGLLDSVREALEIGRSGGVPVQISHHKASGRAAWGLVSESLRLIESARAAGLDASADQYPYTAGSTILAAVVSNRSSGGGRRGLGDLRAADVVIASTPDHPDYEGRNLADLSEEWGVDAERAAKRVLEEQPDAWVVLHSMDERDVRTVMCHPSTMIGSDGVPTDGGKPHPRLYGTFPRVLGHYARKESLISLETAIHRMTGMPATKFRLEDRGFIREGAHADLVIFDPATIIDTATYSDPRRYPAGIKHVLVNGTAVVSDGQHTGARPGRALRRG